MHSPIYLDCFLTGTTVQPEFNLHPRYLNLWVFFVTFSDCLQTHVSSLFPSATLDYVLVTGRRTQSLYVVSEVTKEEACNRPASTPILQLCLVLKKISTVPVTSNFWTHA